MKTYINYSWKKLIIYILISIVLLIEAQGGGDFKIFLDASRDLFHDKNIYSELYNEWYHYYYDTMFTIIIYPLHFLPLYASKFLWLALNIFAIKKTWEILQSWVPIEVLSEKLKKIFVIISFVIMARFIRDNLHLSQLTIMILYLSIEGINCINKGKLWLGALLIGIGISVKILPIVLLPYLMYRNYWKGFLFTIVCLVLIQLFPILFLGKEQTFFLLIERWKLINPTNAAHILDTSERSFHSLTTLCATLFIENCGDTHALSIRRHITNVSIETLNTIIIIVRISMVVFTFKFIGLNIFKKQKNKFIQLYELSYILLIIPLIFPHQQFYAFYLIFPAITYLNFYWILFFNKNVISKTKKYTLMTIFIFIYFILNSHLLLGAFNNYYDHFKTLTYGVLLLIPLLTYCKPGKINKEIESHLNHNKI